MPHVGCNPDARCDAGKRKKESNLEAPEKVIVIKWAKKKYTGGKQDPKATSGVLPATAPCHLPDIEKADQGEEPNHKQLSPDVPMRQPPKSEKNQPRKKIRCSLCCAKKSANRRVPVAIFSKTPNGRSTPSLNMSQPINGGGAAISSSLASFPIDPSCIA